MNKKIKRALISVSDKSQLIKILPTLKKFKIEILSSGGTYKYIKKNGFKCIEVSDFTNFQEILLSSKAFDLVEIKNSQKK